MIGLLARAGLVLSMVGGVATPDAVPHGAEAEIRQVQALQAEAWNRHDAAAYAKLFTEDGDVVNVVGWWWKGRAEIESKLTAAFSFMFRDSTLTIRDVRVRFPGPGVAVARVRWSMTGAKNPPGLVEPKEGIQLQVLEKRAGRWLISGFQNTNSLPETAFPTAGGRQDARGDILRLDAEWSRAAAEGRDVDRVLSFWSDDAVVLPPGSPPVVGRAAIREFVAKSFQAAGFSISWKTADVVVAQSGEVAYSTGTNRVAFRGPDGSEVVVNGKAVAVWRKNREGVWKCVLDIWNDVPPSPSR